MKVVKCNECEQWKEIVRVLLAKEAGFTIVEANAFLQLWDEYKNANFLRAGRNEQSNGI